MSTDLNSLAGPFKASVFELLARLTEQRIPVVIVNTRRTAAEQAANVAKGVSWVAHSMHEDGLAIDIAPYETFVMHGANKLQWDITDPVWTRIGQIGESLGLRWGGRWQQKDMGHFEYIVPRRAEEV